MEDMSYDFGVSHIGTKNTPLQGHETLSKKHDFEKNPVIAKYEWIINLVVYKFKHHFIHFNSIGLSIPTTHMRHIKH